MAALQQGRIVWVRLGPRGDWKLRPAVVLATVENPQPDSIIRVMVGTSNFKKPLTENEIAIPFHPPTRPHPLTKLKTETVLVTDWLVKVQYSEVESVGGFVPNGVLFQALERTKESGK